MEVRPPRQAGRKLTRGLRMLAENGVNVRNEAAHLRGVAAGLLRARRPAEAIVPLQAVALLRPGDVAIHHDLGLACLECGRVGEAIVALQRAVAIDADFADAQLRLGIALESSGALSLALSRAATSFPP